MGPERGGGRGRSQGGLPGGGCILKEGRIGTGMVFYKQSGQLEDQAGGEAGTQVGEDGRGGGGVGEDAKPVWAR